MEQPKPALTFPALPHNHFESLYVHFPFCESKCHYCDFYSLGQEQTATKDPIIFSKALYSECLAASQYLAPNLKTLFFGGGTPSMTPPNEMKTALKPLELEKRLTDSTEWTMEVNPSSVDRKNLKEYRAFGVNRISMGVQSLNSKHLKLLGRVHSREAALSALEALTESGFNSISVDLICGVPGQTIGDIKSAIEELTQFPITHLSCYLLTLPKGHPLFKQLPTEDEQLEHLLNIDSLMNQYGFLHYEISNYCRPGFEAKHNLAYWKNQSYLGLGPSAHSHCEPLMLRWKSPASLHRYSDFLTQNKLPVESFEILSTHQIELEKWMLGLRLSEGIPIEWTNETSSLIQKTKTLLQNGLLERHPESSNKLRLTPRGFALCDSVIGYLSIGNKKAPVT